MRFDIYGRFQIELRREGEQWAAFRPGAGTLVRLTNLVIPADVGEAELATFLDDHFHELGEPGRSVRRVG